MDKKLDDVTARAELAQIATTFDKRLTDEIVDRLLTPAIEGRLYLDGEKIRFVLARPSENLSELVFEEPDGGQIERAGKGVKVTKTSDGTDMTLADAQRLAINSISACTGKGIGEVLRLKARDLKVAEVIVRFFD